MKKIGFFPNINRDNKLQLTRELMGMVVDMGYEAVIFHDVNSWEDVDFAVVLGGDGTVLRAAQPAARAKTPILGINLGNIGYLTDVECIDAKSAVLKVLNGNFCIEKRMMLEVNLGICENFNNRKFVALNEISIARGRKATLISCDVRINGEFMDNFRGDGIILATPTGSTAYNLAAGGPILKPDSEIIAITPVCPHCLICRPVVVSAEDIIDINFKNDADIGLYVDGKTIEISDKNPFFSLNIRRSELFTNIIKTNKNSFYQIMRTKMLKN